MTASVQISLEKVPGIFSRGSWDNGRTVAARIIESVLS